MKRLEEYIKDKEISFSSCGRDIETDIEDFGRCNRDLVDHILEKAGNYITISGSGLEEYLTEPTNLSCMAIFVTQLRYGHEWGTSIHVEVDIDKLSEHYEQPEKLELVNGFGQVICDAAGWMPEISYFEKCWYFELENVLAGLIGSPGYASPLGDEETFRHCVMQHSENFMIGTKKQLERYEDFAKFYLDKLVSLADDISNDPDSVLKDYSRLSSAEVNAHQARNIAQNLSYFTYDYDRKD